MTISFTFFLGIFWRTPTRITVHNEKSWYYINRGHPIAWAGAAKPSSRVDFPIVKAPFLTRRIDGDSFNKIIDLRIFLPLFLGLFLISYPIAFVWSKAAEENKALNIIFIPGYIFFIAAAFFFYFLWFPRI